MSALVSLESRERARIYSRALGQLRENHRDEFNTILNGLLERPHSPLRAPDEVPHPATNAAAILRELAENIAGLTGTELAERLGLQYTSTRVALDRLCEGGWVAIAPQRRRRPGGVRPALIWLATEKARREYVA